MSATKTDNKRWKLLKKAFAIAKHEHGMAPDVFRETVPSWGYPRLSNCNEADLRALIRDLNRWFTAEPSPHSCSQSQLDYLQTLWEIKSRDKSKQSLKKYLLNNFDAVKPAKMSPGRASMAIQSLKNWGS